MRLQTMYEFEPERKRNAAFRVGVIAGVVMIVVHLTLWVALRDMGSADFVAWIIEWFVMLFAARSAAQQQHATQRESLEPLQGVQGAGIGAALITAVIVWLFIIVRDLFFATEFFSVALGILRIPLDVIIALALGALGASSVLRRGAENSNGFY